MYSEKVKARCVGEMRGGCGRLHGVEGLEGDCENCEVKQQRVMK